MWRRQVVKLVIITREPLKVSNDATAEFGRFNRIGNYFNVINKTRHGKFLRNVKRRAVTLASIPNCKNVKSAE